MLFDHPGEISQDSRSPKVEQTVGLSGDFFQGYGHSGAPDARFGTLQGAPEQGHRPRKRWLEKSLSAFARALPV
jgi:hypothetical protein